MHQVSGGCAAVMGKQVTKGFFKRASRRQAPTCCPASGAMTAPQTTALTPRRATTLTASKADRVHDSGDHSQESDHGLDDMGD